jgi:hypothetical protein
MTFSPWLKSLFGMSTVKTRRPGRPRRRSARVRPVRPRLDALEDRTVPSNFALGAVATDISNQVSSLNGTLQALGAFQHVPIIGKGLSTLSDVTSNFSDFLHTAAQFATVNSTSPQQPDTIYSNGGVTVTAYQANNGQTLELTIQERLAPAGHSLYFPLDLALGQFFQVHGARLNVDLAATLHLEFNFQVDSQGNATNPSLGNNNSLGLTGNIPLTGPFDATIGGLLDAYVQVGSGSGLNNVSVQLPFNSSFVPGAPVLNATAAANLHVDLAFAHDASGNPQPLPPIDGVTPPDLHLTTDFAMQWTLSNVGSDPASATNLGSGNSTISTLEFDKVNLDLGVTLPSFLTPIAQDVQRLIEPMKPFLDFFKKDVPILKDFGVHETFGDLALQSHLITPDENNAIHQIENFDTWASEIANVGTVAGNRGTLSIPLTSKIDLTQNSGSQLAHFFQGISTIVPQDVVADVVSSVETVIQSLAPSDPAVAQAFQGFLSGQTYGLQFPFLSDPQNTVIKLLLGQKATLITYDMQPLTGDLQAAAGVDVGLFGLTLGAGLHLEADLSAGYDSTGLKAAAQAILTGHGNDLPSLARDLLHGFYVDNSATGLHLTGSLSAELSFVAVASVTGSIDANVNLSFNNPPRSSEPDDPPSYIRLDAIIDRLSQNPIGTFALQGDVTASADINLGLELGVFNINGWSYHLGDTTIVSFNTAAGATAGSAPSTPPNDIRVQLQNYNETIYIRPYSEVVLGDQSIHPIGYDGSVYTRIKGIEVLYGDGSYNLYPTETELISLDTGLIIRDPQAVQDQPAGYYYIDNNSASSGNQTIIVQATNTEYHNDSELPTIPAPPPNLSQVWNSLGSIALNAGNLVGNAHFDVSQFTEHYSGTASLVGAFGDNTLIGGTFEVGGYGHSTLIGPSGRSATLIAGGYLSPDLDLGSYLQAGAGSSTALIGGWGNDWFEVPIGPGTTTRVAVGADSNNLVFPGNDTLHVIEGPFDASVSPSTNLTVASPSPSIYTITATASGNSTPGQVIAGDISALEISEEGYQSATVNLGALGALHLQSVSVAFDQRTTNNVVNVSGSQNNEMFNLVPDGHGNAAMEDHSNIGDLSETSRLYLHGMTASDQLAINPNGYSVALHLTVDFSYNFTVSMLGSDPFMVTAQTYQQRNILIVSGGNFAQETDNVLTAGSGTIRFNNGQGPSIDYANADQISDTAPVTDYTVTDTVTGVGQEIDVRGEFNPIISSSALYLDPILRRFVRLPLFSPLSLDNKASITINGNTRATDYTLNSSASANFTFNGGSGQDTFTVNYAQNQDTVSIRDAGAVRQSILNVNDLGNQDSAPVYTFSANGFERVGRFLAVTDDVIFQYSNLQTVNITGGNTGNTFNISTTPADTATVINAGTGSDRVTVAESIIQFAGVVPGLGGSLTVNGDGRSTALLLDDHAVQPATLPSGQVMLPGPSSYTIDQGYVERQSVTGNITNGFFSTYNSQAIIGYANLGSVTVQDVPAVVNLGTGQTNSFHIYRTGGTNEAVIGVNSPGAQVTVGIARAITNDGDGGLNDIGQVMIAGHGDTALNLDDSGNGTASFTVGTENVNVSDGAPTFNLTNGQVQRTGAVGVLITDAQTGIIRSFTITPNAATIGYSSIARLTLTGGAVRSTFNVQGNGAGTTTTINAGATSDAVNFGDRNNSLDRVAGTVAVNGDGSTTVRMDDEATQNYIAADFALGDSHLGTGTFYDLYQNTPAYTVTYQGVQRVNRATFTEYFVPKGSQTSTLTDFSPTTYTTSVIYAHLAGLELDGANLQDIDNTMPREFATNSSSNTFTIQSGTLITVQAGNGGDTIQAGDVNNSLDNIGRLSVIGNTGTRLVLDDEANQTVTARQSALFGDPIDYTQPTFVVAGTTVSRINPVTQTANQPYPDYTTFMNVQYQNPAALTIIGGRVTTTATGVRTGNTFDVEAVPAGENVSIQAGVGSDTVNVGSNPANLSQSIFDGIQGTVAVYGQGPTNGPSNTALNVYDQGTTSTQNWDVANSWIDRYPAGGSRPAGPPLTYHHLATVTVNTGTGQNFISVQSTAADTNTLVNGNGGGYDETFVENAADVLNDIQGPLHVHDVSASNLFILDSLNAVGYTYILTTGEVQRIGVQPITITYNNPITITYDNMGQVVVATANNPYFGHSANTVNVQSLGSTTFAVGQNGSMANILGDLRIQSVLGQVPRQVTLDDSADAASRTVALSGGDPTFGYLVSGLLPPSSVGRGRIGLQLDSATPVSILTGPGNDTFRIHDLAGAPSLALDAGGGTNTLDYSAYVGRVEVILPLGLATGFAGGIKNIENVTGGQGNNLLVGDARANVLIGGTGRNVLIGGGGADTLDASSSTGDNILIGGTTTYAGTPNYLADLDAIFAEWTRTDLPLQNSWQIRYSDLKSGTNTAGYTPLNQVNGTTILLNEQTVQGDGVADLLRGSVLPDPLTGERVHNWFFYENGIDTVVNFDPRRDHETKVK